MPSVREPLYKYIYIYNFFILIYRRHVTASVCDIMWYRFFDMVWLFLLAISWESKEFAHPQLLEAMTSPEFRILRVLALSHDVLRECFFLALLNNGWTTDNPCKVNHTSPTPYHCSDLWKCLGSIAFQDLCFFIARVSTSCAEGNLWKTHRDLRDLYTRKTPGLEIIAEGTEHSPCEFTKAWWNFGPPCGVDLQDFGKDAHPDLSRFFVCLIIFNCWILPLLNNKSFLVN